MNTRDIKAVGFDWEGTLVDSMLAKAQCFAEAVVEFYPKLKGKENEIGDIYLATRGYLRQEQLRFVLEKYALAERSENLREWSDLFTSLYINKKLPLFDDAIKVLEELRKRGYKLFLFSSVPQADLDKNIDSYPVRHYFEFILGSSPDGTFKKAKPHLTYASRTLAIPFGEMAFVSDSPLDAKGANELGIFSVGKADPRVANSRHDFEKANPRLIIEDLEELLEYF